jgi:hypothetical protein
MKRKEICKITEAMKKAKVKKAKEYEAEITRRVEEKSRRREFEEQTASEHPRGANKETTL